MKQVAYCLFETPLGWCRIGWNENEQSGTAPSVSLLQLPARTPQLMEAKNARHAGPCSSTTPPPSVAAVIRRVCQHFQGEVQDFRDVIIDLAGVPNFARQVYAATRQILPGQTTTYGALAKSLNRRGAARAVGQALARNPIALLIPCHRVLGAGGRPGGFSAYGGLATKAKMLAVEGVTFGECVLMAHGLFT
jgi:methylated-DNA-[protein]-cysteine S-methyltransferase